MEKLLYLNVNNRNQNFRRSSASEFTSAPCAKNILIWVPKCTLFWHVLTPNKRLTLLLFPSKHTTTIPRNQLNPCLYRYQSLVEQCANYREQRARLTEWWLKQKERILTWVLLWPLWQESLEERCGQPQVSGIRQTRKFRLGVQPHWQWKSSCLTTEGLDRQSNWFLESIINPKVTPGHETLA